MSAAEQLRPVAPEVRPDAIPEALRALPHWVLWRYELADGKWTKVPYQDTGAGASTTNPMTWRRFPAAMHAYRTGKFDGIGFVVTDADEFVGIDLDHATESAGSPKPAASKILHTFASYTERTPSGEGFRAWILGRKPDHAGCKRNDFDGAGTDVEIYQTGRFFTVTGHRITGSAHTIEPRQEALEALCNELWPQRKPKAERTAAPASGDEALPDEELLTRARNAKNSGEKFRALFDDGDTSGHGGDQSGADLALCNLLAFWTGREPEQMDRLFRRSKLMRDKWDEQRGQLTYAQKTIGKAIEDCDTIYSPQVNEVDLSALLGKINGTTPPPEVPHKKLVNKDDHDQAARLFSALHPDWRYTAAFGQWAHYNAECAIWEADEKLRHLTLVRDMIRAHGDKKMRRASEVAGIASLARSNATAAMGANDWDRDPWLLGTPGAVIDLRTGEPVPDAKACYVTKQCAVPVAPPGTLAPVWFGFLERITRHDPELVDYLQRIFGYALTGSDREQCIFFAHGPGGNGKGVTMNTMIGVMGGYAWTASGDLLLAAKGDRHPTDLASLRGARLVTASELRPGARWDEQRLKSLTGGDPITARRMRQDEFTFRPQFTLVIAGNHRPSFSGVDESIRRRLRLIPFTQVIPEGERDPDLPEKLRTEWPAILRWAIDGCLLWQRHGLCTPRSVREASAAYLEAEDSLGQWIEDRLQRHPPGLRYHTARNVLFNDWQAWAADNGGPVWSPRAFYLALEERGFTPHIRDGKRGFRDVSPVSTTPHQGWR